MMKISSAISWYLPSVCYPPPNVFQHNLQRGMITLDISPEGSLPFYLYLSLTQRCMFHIILGCGECCSEDNILDDFGHESSRRTYADACVEREAKIMVIGRILR